MKSEAQDLSLLLRLESGRILAALLIYTRDFQLAEDALQEASLQALIQWAKSGEPDNKAAWIMTAAKRRLIDRLRKEDLQHKVIRQQQCSETYHSDSASLEEQQDIPDERLKLIFTCCHPALAADVRVPLTLKTLCGFKVREIARAYLCSESAMEKRLVRAKRKIIDAGIPYQVPEGEMLEQYLPSVLSVIYLIYNESYSAFEGQTLTREDLAKEAIRLARILEKRLPRPQTKGLLALILLHDARRLSRVSAAGVFIPLAEQNRELWDRALIQEGTKLVSEALAESKPDVYQVQAAISALHGNADSWAGTDWPQILQLYKVLYQLDASPVVALNAAVALANSGEYLTAFKQLNKLAPALETYQPFFAARADLAAKVGEKETSLHDYQKAIKLTKNAAEVQFLNTQMSRLNSI